MEFWRGVVVVIDLVPRGQTSQFPGMDHGFCKAIIGARDSLDMAVVSYVLCSSVVDLVFFQTIYLQ